MSELKAEVVAKIKKLSEGYPTREAALLPALYAVQYAYGWVSRDHMDAVAALLDIAPIRVYGVATFYTMYHKKPVGKHLIQVCTNVSCLINNAEDIVAHLKQQLGIEVGQTTADNLFTLIEVECLGNCGNAPVMKIDEIFYENLTSASVDAILQEYRKKAS